MKGVNQPGDHFQDFLQDACEFLEDTLSKEKLSRTAMEHRTRLMAKISSLMKDQLRPPSVDMYIDMNSHPTLRAFFTSDSSTSGTDTSSIQGRNGNDEIYDEAAHLDEPDGGQAIYNEAAEAPDELVLSEPPPPPPPIKSNKTFLSMFMKTMGRNKTPKPPPKQDDVIYDDAAVNYNDPVYDDATELRNEDQQIIYDDVNCSHQGLYDDVRTCPGGKSIPVTSKSDVDAMSIKSGLSESSVISSGTSVGQHGTSWSMSAKEAQAQALMSGVVKRRDCRKLLSAWRSSYAILLPTQLLFYSSDADGKPKAVLDLAPDIRVRRAINSKQQAGDAKRVKMQPFLIDLDGKPLYEVSTKSRLETENWIGAIQSATSSRVPDVIPSRQQQDEETDDARSAEENTDVDEDEDNIYEDLESFQQAVQQQPVEEVPEVRSSKIRSRLSFFKFKRSSTQSEGSAKRHSLNSTSNGEDIYHDPTSPLDSKNATPYDSIESLEHNKETAEVYNSLERQTVEAPAAFDELIKNMKSALKSVSSGYVRSHSDNVNQNAEESEPPAAVYDTPSPTVRPLSPTNDINSFANLILQNQAKVMRRLSDSQNGAVQHYDVPTSNQKIVDQPVEEVATYDHVVSPPRAVQATPVVVEAPKAKKMAQFWQEKVSFHTGSAKTPLKPSLVKETPAIKETQSVGRSFGRGTQRMPLSAVPENSEKQASVAQILASFKSTSTSIQAAPLSNTSPNKKDPPPRPPAPLLSKGPQTPPKNTPEDTKPASDKLHTARWAYVAQNPLELSLNKGEVVQVMNPAGPSWLVRSTRNNKKGLVPREYLVAN